MSENNITTKCSKCSFGQNGVCTLGKNTSTTEEGMQLRGFCRHKRITKIELLDVAKEETSLSAVILSLDNDIENIKVSLDSLSYANKTGLVKQVVIVVKEDDKSKLKQLFETAVSMSMPWNILVCKDEESTELRAIDEAMATIKYNWFMVMKAGDKLSGNKHSYIKTTLEFVDIPVLMFYSEENDDIRITTNKSAFMELCGNVQLPFFNKIKHFDNWKEICLQIN